LKIKKLSETPNRIVEELRIFFLITQADKATMPKAEDIPHELEIRTVILACRAKFSLVNHQLESYDNFVQSILPSIVKENSVLVACYPMDSSLGYQRRLEFIFRDVTIQPPSLKEASGFINQIRPSEARIRGATYASSIFVTIEQRTLHVPIKNGNLLGEEAELQEKKIYMHMLLCRMPVMIGSCLDPLRKRGDLQGECPYDDGGYFVVNGQEKVVISQERLRTNFPYIFPPRKTAASLGTGIGKSMLCCEVRSSHESKLRSTSTVVLHLLEAKAGQPPELVVVLPYLECPVSLPWLLMLLGWEPDGGGASEIIRMAVGDLAAQKLRRDSPMAAMLSLITAIANSMESIGRQTTRDEVLDSIGRRGTHELDKERRDKYINYICCSETLPHMGVDNSADTKFAKRVYLGHMMSKLTGVLLGLLPYDNRDHYSNKRLDCTGPLMAHLFRQLYRSFLKSLQAQIQKAITGDKFVDLVDSRFINHKRISAGFKLAFGTGNWGTPKAAGGQGTSVGQVGITQALSQLSGVSATAHARRMNTPLHKEGRNPKPRQLCNSAWGIVCATETPEGIACGLVKNLASDTRVRVGTKTSLMVHIVRQIRMRDADEIIVRGLEHLHHKPRSLSAIEVTVNGVILGHCDQRVHAEYLVERLHTMRRTEEIPFDTSVALLDNPWQSVVRVQTDSGALLRPVVVASRLADFRAVVHKYRGAAQCYSHLWAELLSRGIMEYIDKDEESALRIAEAYCEVVDDHPLAQTAIRQGQPFTHVELHPSVINGLCASLIPFSNHNQAPRNTYQSAMGKQALGIPATNYFQRMDAMLHVLCSPQRPLVSTWMENSTNCGNLPAGQNVMVAIMCYSGFNQEDSLIMCRSSIQAGMFHSVCFRTSKEETCSNGTDLERFEVPDAASCTRLKAASYEHLDSDTGGARVGAFLKSGDVIIGKTVTTTDTGCDGKVKVVRDQSVQVKAYEDGEVDRVIHAKNQETKESLRVRTQKLRIPVIGDKFSSRHGQKGIVGMIYERKDMPFTDEGLTPDIIVNPHAIPSRMTIGHLFETLLGSDAALAGELGDGTPFRDLSVEQVAQSLEARGYDKYCNTYMNCGLSGKRTEAQIFFGPTHYQRLKHTVGEKIHARSRGPVQPLTRQPMEGRSREGGLRIGEMERDAISAHGAAANIR
jgi:DNA-directed RNA polymerase II subunit RPB2